MTENFYRLSSLVLTVLSFLILLLLCLNSYFWSDDFWFIHLFKTTNYWKATWDLYLGWDGRSLSLPYHVRNILLLIFPPEGVALFATFFFVGTGYFVARILFSAPKTIQIHFYYAIIGSIALWLLMRPHLSRSLYWPTGSHYAAMNLFLAAFAFVLFKPNAKKGWLWSLAFLGASGGANTASAAWALFFGKQAIEGEKSQWKRKLSTLVFLIFGAFPVVFAPGNFARAKSGGDNIQISSLEKLLGNFHQVFAEYMSMSKPLLIIAPVLGLLILGYNNIENNHLKSTYLKRAAIFVLAALASIAPFLFIASSASKHTSIHFQLFLLIGASFIAAWLFHSFRLLIISKKLHCVMGFLLMGSFIAIGAHQFVLGRDVKAQAENRLELLIAAEGNQSDTLKLPNIQMPSNLFTNRIWDLSVDSQGEFNLIYSEIFNTGPIVIEDQ